MTLRDLEVFIAVCETNNITAAAERLHIAQPSASQVIAGIEKEYGVRLFERFGKRLYITEAGRLLQDYARHILFSFYEMEDRLQGSGIIHTTHIGASVTVGTCLLSTITQNFRKVQPEIRIEALVDNTRIIENQILNNQLDLGLVEGNVHHPQIMATPFMDDELVLACGKTHPLYGKKMIGKKELSSLDFIVREEGSGTRELFVGVMNANGIPWTAAWVCNNAEGIKNAVIAGIGVTVISRMLLDKESTAGDIHILAIDGIEFKRKFNIIYHHNKYLTEPIRQFIDNCLL
jgi:Transcriptional regulator